MPNKAIITTTAAPEAIGTYSQAVKASGTVYLSGQIPLDPETMTLVEGGFDAQAHRVFRNLAAVCEAAGGTLQDMVKVNIYLTDMSHFATLNDIMARYFAEPYPARAAVEVSALPKGALIEMDGVMVI